ncbi:phosphoenolpyruvate carboxykinase (ATP) [soil metagenome]
MLDLSPLGISNLAHTYHNLSTPALYEEAIRRREGTMGHLGSLVVRTGQYTGRSPKDKFIVRDDEWTNDIWWGEHNNPIEHDSFDILFTRLQAYLQGRDVFVQDCYTGADPEFRLRTRIITEDAWHNMFARDMFIREFDPDVLDHFEPEWTVINCPRFKAIPKLDGTRSEAFIIVNLAKRLTLIGGTSYAGEIKKSMFSVMNYLLPRRGVLTMHSSANEGADGDVTVFFGLSGTGKTTLSTASDRAMIGDDEHGWSDQGVFNFEGGSYAKMIHLDPEAEPEIYSCTRRFGTILENVAIDPATRRLDLDDDSLTENTRGAYPLSHLPNVKASGMGGHPNHVIMLTADAFGVLPPISRLTAEQAQYHFMSGYTAKVAGTERGVKEPRATFSACFGAPFMPLHPTVYAEMLAKKLAGHGVQAWLLNTGWTGGPYGVGSRLSIQHSRAMVRAAISGALDDVEYVTDPVFGLAVPTACPDVPAEVLWPRQTWSDPEAYDTKAADLARMFVDNFAGYDAKAAPEVAAAGPPGAAADTASAATAR